MEQLDLFASGELVEIREYLHVWNEAERAKRLTKKARSNDCQEIRRAESVMRHVSHAVPACRVEPQGFVQADSQPGHHACRLKDR